MVLPMDVYLRAGRPMPIRGLARMATTGIYLVRGIPRELQRAARVRAANEGTTLRSVLLQSLREYAAGTWTPQAAHKLPEAAHDRTSPNGPARPPPG
jgi:hypothetical protein